jgi:hypothetical protein
VFERGFGHGEVEIEENVKCGGQVDDLENDEVADVKLEELEIPPDRKRASQREGLARVLVHNDATATADESFAFRTEREEPAMLELAHTSLGDDLRLRDVATRNLQSGLPSKHNAHQVR